MTGSHCDNTTCHKRLMCVSLAMMEERLNSYFAFKRYEPIQKLTFKKKPTLFTRVTTPLYKENISRKTFQPSYLYIDNLFYLWYSHGAHVAWCTYAFPCLVVAGGTVEALALQLAAFSIVARLTLILTAPALVAVCADTGSCDGVTQCPILALTAVAAVGTPVATFTTWYTKKKKGCFFTPANKIATILQLDLRVEILADQYDTVVLNSEQQVVNRWTVILELPIHKIWEVIEFYYRTYAEVYRFAQCFVNTSESHCERGLAEA